MDIRRRNQDIKGKEWKLRSKSLANPWACFRSSSSSLLRRFPVLVSNLLELSGCFTLEIELQYIWCCFVVLHGESCAECCLCAWNEPADKRTKLMLESYAS